MKCFVSRMVIGFVVCALMSVMALAKGKSADVTFLKDVTVNGTVVKKGEYKIVFDEQANELYVMKGKTVVAKTTAHVDSNSNKKADYTVTLWDLKDSSMLTGIIFAGDTQAIIVGSKGEQPANSLP